VSDTGETPAVPWELVQRATTASPATKLAGSRAGGRSHGRLWGVHAPRRAGWADLPPGEEPGRGRRRQVEEVEGEAAAVVVVEPSLVAEGVQVGVRHVVDLAYGADPRPLHAVVPHLRGGTAHSFEPARAVPRLPFLCNM
jgi:hypothetical protein